MKKKPRDITKEVLSVCLTGEDGEMYNVPIEELDDFMKRADAISNRRKKKEKSIFSKLKKTEKYEE